MALAAVESTRFPYLPLTLTLGARTLRVEALLDTGFDGDVALPRGLIATGDPPDAYSAWQLADGSEVIGAVYFGTAQIGDLPAIGVDVTAVGDEPLISRGVSDQYQLVLDHGRRIVVEP